MNALISLWLPILLGAVVVFIISSLVHMVFKWHAGDYSEFPNEDAVRAAINAGNPRPGRYMMPHCKEMKDMGTEAMRRKFEEGPVAHMTIGPSGVHNMGKYLGQWFLLCLLVSAVAAYLPAKAYGLQAPALGAAKMAGVVAFIGYGFGTLQESIWMMRPWPASAKYLLDSALYALGTAVTFYLLWP